MLPPRISLKARLRAATVLLVLMLVLVLAGLNLHHAVQMTFKDAQERAETNAALVRVFLLQRIEDRVATYKPAPSTLEESKAAWTAIIQQDRYLPELLNKALANSLLVADIMITDENSRILTASNPAHAGGIAPHLPDYLAWQNRSLPSRILEIFSKNQDYAITIPLGAVGDDRALFTIRIIISSLVMREAVRPELTTMAGVSLGALFVSLIYAFVFSNLMLRPLARIGDTIDRIAAGNHSADPLRGDSESPEFADLQSKLGVLDRQFRGAREDALQLRSSIDQLLQRMEEVVLVFDSGQRLVMAGRPAERLFGRSRAELIGSSIHALLEGQPQIESAIRTAIEFHKPLTDLLANYTGAGGEERHLLLNLDWNESELMLTLRDAESRKVLASHLDLSSRLAAISRLTGGVAHEIKNPLNAIAIHLEVLKTRIASEDTEMQAEVEVIAREIARLDRVVKTFLNFTRPVEVRLTSLDLAAVTGEICRLVEAQAANARVTIELQGADNTALVWADPDLIKQVLLNVVGNAIEAMPSGGPVSVRLLQNGTAVSVEIEDRGVGIPESVQQKIFQLYFTTKSGGSGIGLAVTFQAVQLMGGSIAMHSQEGKGTLFRLSFPAAGMRELETGAQYSTERAQTWVETR